MTSTEALIEDSSLEVLPEGTSGIGACDGVKTENAGRGIYANVSPKFLKCSGCQFSDVCSESMAD